MEEHPDTVYDEPDKLHVKETGFVTKKHIKKPWGGEELVVCTPRYVMKFLNVNPGERLSLQYHKEKMETLHVMDGEGILFLGKDVESVEQHPLREGMIVHIMPGTVHTFEAKTKLRLLEVSTPEIWDVVRLQDKYERAEKRG